jgi:hypothetical protein
MPPEVQMIMMGHIIDVIFPLEATVHHNVRLSSCGCRRDRAYTGDRRMVQALLSKHFAKKLPDIFFENLFKRRTIKMYCTCDLLAHLQKHPHFFSRARSIRVQWCGWDAPKAFLQLAKCPRLTNLTIDLVRHTYSYESELSAVANRHFRVRHPARLTHVVGFAEMAKIRGLQVFKVMDLVHARTSLAESVLLQTTMEQFVHLPKALPPADREADEEALDK